MKTLSDVLLQQAENRLLKVIEQKITALVNDHHHVWAGWPGTRHIALAVYRAVEDELGEQP